MISFLYHYQENQSFRKIMLLNKYLFVLILVCYCFDTSSSFSSITRNNNNNVQSQRQQLTQRPRRSNSRLMMSSIEKQPEESSNNKNNNNDQIILKRIIKSSLAVEESRRSWFSSASSKIIMAATAAAATSKILTEKESEKDPLCCRCLLNLPPKSSNMIRLYLCHDGQTENNRFAKSDTIIYGQDPPLNSNGIQMAERLGIALRTAVLHDNNKDDDDILFYHSPMLRAKQTATIAASQFYNIGRNQNDDNEEEQQQADRIQYRPLSSLTEVNFSSTNNNPRNNNYYNNDYNNHGPYQIQSLLPSRSKIDYTYQRWSDGYIDDRLGHESARDIYHRCEVALTTMIKEATSSTNNNNKSIITIAHGSYLRMLLSLLMDLPLSTVRSTLQFDNASISVLDIPATSLMVDNKGHDNKSNGINNNIESTASSLMASSDLHLSIPKTIPLRINEVRHLNGVSIE